MLCFTVFQDKPMSNLKKVDCALLPPCAKTVQKKLERAHLISIIWGNADSAKPGHGLEPQNYGWKEKDGFFTQEWFLGDAMPDYLFRQMENGENNTESQEKNQPDEVSAFDDDDGDCNAWSDDSESETEC